MQYASSITLNNSGDGPAVNQQDHPEEECDPAVYDCTTDSDGDGEPDWYDDCPNDPGPPENYGCPVGAPDSDGDGVPDNVDGCPNEPGPEWNGGCPDNDPDGDGIVNEFDDCPNDPAYPPNEVRGCPDDDGDGVANFEDACPGEMEDYMGVIDGCADASDMDSDGVPDDQDNCISVTNPNQADWDNDGLGDICDDGDQDGIYDNIDQCRTEKETVNGYQDEDGCPDTPPVADSDGDGVGDDIDQCPGEMEDYQGVVDGCPNPDVASVDTDGDGIYDDVDQCISQPETFNGYQDTDGCPDTPPVGPTDSDGDGLNDVDDDCPFIPGPSYNFGCPDAPVDDTDGDGIYDDVDQCILQAEIFNGYQDEDGCPDHVPVGDSDGDGVADDIDQCPSEIEDYQGVVDGCPEGVDPRADFNAGLAYYEAGNYAAAANSFQASLLQLPDDYDTYGYLASSYAQLDNWTALIEVLGDGLAYFPNDPNFLQGIEYAQDQLVGTGTIDTDGDGIPNDQDNCPNIVNPDQADFNNDGSGDVCTDTDGDGYNDDVDGCPTEPGTLRGGGCPDGGGVVYPPAMEFLLDTETGNTSFDMPRGYSTIGIPIYVDLVSGGPGTVQLSLSPEATPGQPFNYWLVDTSVSPNGQTTLNLDIPCDSPIVQHTITIEGNYNYSPYNTGGGFAPAVVRESHDFMDIMINVVFDQAPECGGEPPTTDFNELLELAYQAGNSANWQLALNYLIQAETIDPNHDRVLTGLAVINYELGNWEAALQYLYIILPQVPADQVQEIRDMIADAEAQLGGGVVDTDRDGVPDNVDQCIYDPGPASNDGCPADEPVSRFDELMELARQAYDGGNMQLALSYVYQMEEIDPNHPDVIGGLAWLNFELENYEECLPYLRKAMNLAPAEDKQIIQDLITFVEGELADTGPKDTDGDGILDTVDKCPNKPETKNGYLDFDGCPDTPPTRTTDSDKDGIPDTVDKCPTQPETRNGYRDTDGCPDTKPVIGQGDKDRDGILDGVDKCPTLPETKNGYKDTDGCPDTKPTTGSVGQGRNMVMNVNNLPAWNTNSISSKQMFVEVEKFWKEEDGSTFQFSTVSLGPGGPDTEITWIKDFGGATLGFQYVKLIEMGLGDENCQGQWQPFSDKAVTNTLVHEVGHAIGYPHASDPNNVMFPTSPVQYGLVKNKITSVPGYIHSTPLRGCLSTEYVEIKYDISTESNHKLDVYIVPSIQEMEKLKQNQPVKVHPGCINEGISHATGTCKVSQNSVILVNHRDGPPSGLVDIKVSFEELRGAINSPTIILTPDKSPPSIIPQPPVITVVDDWVKTDRESYSISSGTTSVRLTGQLGQSYTPGAQLSVFILLPDKSTQNIPTVVDASGGFSTTYSLSSNSPSGIYQIQGKLNQLNLPSVFFSVFGGTGTETFGSGFTPTSKVLFEHHNPDFSLNIPNTWVVEQNYETVAGDLGLFSLSDDPSNWSVGINVNFYEDGVLGYAVSDDQYIEDMITVLYDDCIFANYDDYGYTCSRLTIVDSEIKTIKGQKAFEVTYNWRDTYDDDTFYDNTSILTEIPVGNDYWEIYTEAIGDSYSENEKLIKETISSFSVSELVSATGKKIVPPNAFVNKAFEFSLVPPSNWQTIENVEMLSGDKAALVGFYSDNLHPAYTANFIVDYQNIGAGNVAPLAQFSDQEIAGMFTQEIVSTTPGAKITTSNVERTDEGYTVEFNFVESKFVNGKILQLQHESVLFLENDGDMYSANFVATTDDFDQEVVDFRKSINTFYVGQVEKQTLQVTGDTGDGGCLIATATFGSELAPQVQFLRELRDNTVLDTASGTSFMSGFNTIYYSFSPTIADWERQNPIFKQVVKTTITPLLSSLTLLNYVNIDSEAEMLGYGIGIILLNIGMYFVAPAIVFYSIRKRFLH